MLSAGEFLRLKELQRKGLSAGQVAERLCRSERSVRDWFGRERYERVSKTGGPSVLDPFKDEIRMWLHEYEGYTSQQLFQKITESGYGGGYTLVKDYVRTVRPPKRQEAHGEYDWQPGECAQVDFGDCGLIRVGEELRKVSVFSMVLSWSRMMYLEFILGQSMEYFLACHQNAFEFFGAVPKAFRPDCCKVAVIGHTPAPQKKPIYNPRYAEFAAYHGASLDACEPRSGWQKPGVERGIGYIKINFLNGKDLSQYTLERLNREGRDWLEGTANVRKHATTQEQPLARFPQDRAAMLPLPANPYDCSVIKQATVDKQARFPFEGNRYSVPPLYHGIRINLHILPNKLLAYYNGKLLAKHKRIYEQSAKPIVLPEHQRTLRKHEARERTRRLIFQFLQLGPIAQTYYENLCERHLDPQTHIRKIMSLAQLYGSDKLTAALEDSHAGGAYSSDYIHNLLAGRRKINELSSPLQLQRRQDLLDIELEKPDLTQYDRYLKGSHQ
jgi:transposase